MNEKKNLSYKENNEKNIKKTSPDVRAWVAVGVVGVGAVALVGLAVRGCWGVYKDLAQPDKPLSSQVASPPHKDTTLAVQVNLRRHCAVERTCSNEDGGVTTDTERNTSAADRKQEVKIKPLQDQVIVN